MPALRNAVEIDVWTVGKLMDAVSGNPNGNSRITIPEFQRRLVWSQATRKGLIDSIKRGHPFGSVLIYEDIARGQSARDGNKYYNLIDGLQRTQALKSYVEYRNGYFTRADLEDEFVDSLAAYLGKYSDEYKDRIRQTIVDWVKEKKGYDAQDGWRTENLVEALISSVLKYPSDSNLYRDSYFELNRNDSLVRNLGMFLDDVSSEVKLVLDAKIPVLIYTGPSSELPTVFELLNSRGTVLSRYEIYAAQWMDHRHQIKNTDVIEAIWKKYETLEEEGFTLDVSEEAPDEESRRNRRYTLFDYLFGFGQYLADKFPRLFRPVHDDRPSSVGFNLMTACLGLHVQDMANLPNEINHLQWEELERCLMESSRFIDNILKPILSAPQYGRKRSPIYHSEFMIISMIATAFQVKFSKLDLSENGGWRTDRRSLKKNIPMFYLYEILHDDWRGSGDGKLYDAVKTLRYVDNAPPSAQRWEQVLDDWYYDSQISLVHSKNSKRHIRDSRPEYLLLKYIFAERMATTKTYHVEHIIPVALLQSHMEETDEWPINTIGNLALLEQAGDLKANVQTYDVMLSEQRRRGDITAEQQEDRLQFYESQLLCPANLLPKPLTKDKYEGFLLERFELLKSEFLRVWRDHIPADPRT
ncbi:MAG: DUF262 domain-containing protein [Chloroflexota bacterium]|nr:DUF262 domain-containing protein [Chloroflexota bacterium]